MHDAKAVSIDMSKDLTPPTASPAFPSSAEHLLGWLALQGVNVDIASAHRLMKTMLRLAPAAPAQAPEQ